MRLSQRSKWIGISVIALLVATFAGIAAYVQMFAPSLADRATGKTQQSQVVEVPFGCDPAEYRHSHRNHGSYPFFRIEGADGEVTGHIFGSASGRWGLVDSLPPEIQDALRASTALVGDFPEEGRNEWYSDFAPESSRRLSAILDKPVFNALSNHFAQCRLGGFWRDMHVSAIDDLFALCAGTHISMSEGKCEINKDIERRAKNSSLPIVQLGGGDGAQLAFDQFSRRDINDYVRQWLESGEHPLGGVPAFSLDEAYDLRAELAESLPLFAKGSLDAQSRAWARGMNEAMQWGGRPFFIVDARNLTGESGVLELLRKRGFQIRPL